MGGWSEKSPEFVAARYDRLAPIYGLFEWPFLLPLLGVRRKAVEALRLERGNSVLEVGCGDGRNFALIQQRIGPEGAIFGVDLSARMLAGAEACCRRHGWTNVQLARADCAEFEPPGPIQAALFSFSYSTMRDRTRNLRRVWDLLEPGGRLVISDHTLSPGWPRRLLLSMGARFSDRTLIGKPDTDPGADLAALAGEVETRVIRFPPGARNVICSGAKASGDPC